jgi:hypothetical protein
MLDEHPRLRALIALPLAAILVAAPLNSQAARPGAGSGLSTPVTGAFDGGTFSGDLTITRFATQAGELVAVGTVSGTLTDLAGNVIGTVTNQAVTLPVTNINGSCQILHLELGPVDLDLLGLVVHLDQVVLDITAESGSGNLLGNLLCAIAGLLDSPGGLQGLLTQIVSLLNQILGALG